MREDDFVFETRNANLLAPVADPLPAPKDTELEQDLARIPDKLAFKIGEVAELVGVKAYVLRFWESEFQGLRPKKASNNQRMYERRDVEQLLLIKKLLYRDRFSIEGARSAMKRLKKQSESVHDLMGASDQLATLKDQVLEVLEKVKRLKKVLQS